MHCNSPVLGKNGDTLLGHCHIIGTRHLVHCNYNAAPKTIELRVPGFVLFLFAYSLDVYH